MKIRPSFATASLALLSLALAAAPALFAAPAGRRPLAGSASKTPSVLGPSSHVLLPTSAAVNGAFGAIFRTRVSITNVTGNSYTIRAGFSDRTGEIAAANITIYGFETLTWDKFLADVFGIGGAGAIDLDSGAAANRFVVNEQVYVDTENGRYSTAVEGADETGTITPDHPGWFSGASVDQFDRTNIGCASDSNQPQHITVRVLDAAGNEVGGTALDLAPYGWDQVPVTTSVSAGALYVTTTQRAVCYGVVVDNVSNDGTFRLVVAD